MLPSYPPHNEGKILWMLLRDVAWRHNVRCRSFAPGSAGIVPGLPYSKLKAGFLSSGSCLAASALGQVLLKLGLQGCQLGPCIRHLCLQVLLCHFQPAHLRRQERSNNPAAAPCACL